MGNVDVKNLLVAGQPRPLHPPQREVGQQAGAALRRRLWCRLACRQAAMAEGRLVA